MGALSTGKRVEVLFENAIETYEHEMQMLERVSVFRPDAADMQHANNEIWRPARMHAPIKEGWDLSGHDGDIIKLFYPATLETPKNDYFKQRADDMRDQQFWEDRGKESGEKQSAYLNQRLAQLVRTQGTLFYRSADNGYDFVAEARAILNERQTGGRNQRTFVLNNRDQKKLAKDLADRQTLEGKPRQVYDNSLITRTAGFDVLEGSYTGVLAGGASPNTTVTGNQSFRPEATMDVAGQPRNIDYRLADVPVFSSAGYQVGDKVKIRNGTAAVNAVSLGDKEDTGQSMTFTVVGVPNAFTLSVFPKPIAADDTTLTAEERAFANINHIILDGAVVERLNVDAQGHANLFWTRDSLEVVGGEAPLHLLSEFGGMKVIKHTMKNGQTMYMAYDGDIDRLTFTCRLFTWWGLVNCNPAGNGVALHTG